MKKIVSIILSLVMLLTIPGVVNTRVKSAEEPLGENIAYKRTITASSIESDEYSASNAVDADGATRWASSFADHQNLIVDLWQPYTISTVKIAWEDAYASQFQVQISNDNTTWTTVYENYNATGGTQTIQFAPVSARYVKIYCIKRATEYGFSIFEIEIYQTNTGGSTTNSNIKGKNLFFLGSSVTYGYASGGVSFVDYIAERNKCTCVKEAVSGTTLVDNSTNSYIQRMLRNFDTSSHCDHFVCQLSTNDASQRLPLGRVSSSYELADFEKSTIIGAMEYIICYAKTTWNCPVTFYTNTYYESEYYQSMVDALYLLQEKWGIGIIDLWNNQEMRNVSASDYARYMSDNIHPTAAGYLEWWTPVFEKYLQSFDYSKYENQGLSEAGKAKQRVLQYFYDMQGNKTVIGMHNREPNSEPAKQTNQAHAITGQYPALWSGDFLFSSSDVANRWNMIYECKNQWESGSIVQLMLHVTPPTQSEAGSWEGGVVSHLSDEQWNSLINDGGDLNRAWKARLDTYATYLQYLKDNDVPVLFRPFHEMNQGIFWWAGRTGTNGTGALYRLTRDYLEKEKGLDNIIWIWDMQDLSYNWSDYNPGNDYWDIFAVDVYNTDYFTSYKYNTALNVAGDKLIAIGECDKLPTANELKAQPRWSFVMSWAELTFSHNTNSEIQNLYWADNVIVRNELPNFKEQINEEPTTKEPETTKEPIVKDGIYLNGANSTTASGLEGNHNFTDAYAWKGNPQYPQADNSYKYLVLTYTGDITDLRLGNDSNPPTEVYWFGVGHEDGTNHSFVTPQGMTVPADGNNTTVVIDLEKSGTAGSFFKSFHVHTGASGKSGNLNITEAYLSQKNPLGGETPTEEPTTEESTTKEPETEKTYTVKVDGTVVMTAKEGDRYTLPRTARIGYYAEGKMYKKGSTYTVTKDVSFSSVDLTVNTGASIRLADPSGLTFKASITCSDSRLFESGAIVNEGMLITTNDLYSEEGSLDFTSEYTYVNIENSGWSGNVAGAFTGSIAGIRSMNYGRTYIGRAYVTVKFADGTESVTYSKMTGVRSVRSIATSMKNTPSVYNGLTAAQRALIDNFVAE